MESGDTIDVGRDVRRDNISGYKELGGMGEVQVPPINANVHASRMHQIGEHTELTIIDAVVPDGGAPQQHKFEIDTSDRDRGPSVRLVSQPGPVETVETKEKGEPPMAIKVKKKSKEDPVVAAEEPIGYPKDVIKEVILSNDDYDDIPLPGASVFIYAYEEDEGRNRTCAIGTPAQADDLSVIPSGVWDVRAVNNDGDTLHESKMHISGAFKTSVMQFLVGQEVLD